MNLPAVCRVPPCCYNRRQPLFPPPSITPQKHMTAHFISPGLLLFILYKKSDKEADGLNLNDPVADKSLELNSQAHQDKDQPLGMLENTSLENNNGAQVNEQSGVELIFFLLLVLFHEQPQQLDESIRIPKETVEILRDQVFGFDTFFVTSQEPYEGGVLFKGNLRGQAAKTYEKVSKRMQEKLGDDYKLFLLINPEDDKPVAVVVPGMTLQPEATAVPEWFAAGAFGLITVFTLLLRNVPALQSNLLSVFDNLDLLKNGLPGALITAFLLVVHEVSHRFVATEVGIKLGIPYFVPSWQNNIGATLRCTPTSLRMYVIYVISAAVEASALYSAFELYLATVCCFLDVQDTQFAPSLDKLEKHSPVVKSVHFHINNPGSNFGSVKYCRLPTILLYKEASTGSLQLPASHAFVPVVCLLI
ncbi:putative zinc metalloprotease EGY2, chloroplastic [Capsicum baccatum]|uniref:Zinc metalloprotease EGY2, chloroplastic n=1 Tax=Capsicum baccatum TaxID=33114 RepID=A0A2G2WJB2_CAPBA|nr:putative zinc metalloprotease EGY2, chloroplastic [Capsicum baccatum]